MPRYSALDSLRGLCACIVVFSHLALSLGVHSVFDRSVVLAPLVAGTSAVFVFFALSGFVLYLSFVAKDGANTCAFLTKRVVRIYPPLLVTVLLAAGAVLFIGPEPVAGLDAWFNTQWPSSVDTTMVLSHLALTDRPMVLDSPLWSLVVELRFSLIFPLIAWAVSKWPITATSLSLAISVLCRHYAASLADSTWNPVFTGEYLFLFTGGAALAYYRDALGALGAKMRRSFAYGSTVIVVAMLCTFPSEFGAMPRQCVAALLLVGLVAYVPVLGDPLLRPVARFFGRVSYSLYLSHMVVILAIVHAFSGWLAPLWALALSVPCVVLMAAVMFHWIERPSILLGRRLGAKASGLCLRFGRA
jgi:peptidoglycan/LPS O-acetylase OafA/YrhL